MTDTRASGMPRSRIPALLFGLSLAACGTQKTPTEPAEPVGSPVPAATFSQIQAQIFTPSCAKAGCHDSASAQSGMVLEAGRSYAQIVGVAAHERPDLSRIAPGDAARSYLLKKLRGDPDITGARMPLDGPPYLDSTALNSLAAWVLAGAPNN